jgi:hypothetical protein
MVPPSIVSFRQACNFFPPARATWWSGQAEGRSDYAAARLARLA